jgi:hypothetical protein
MGERATGPMAKRMSSPQPGAVALAMGRPKMETDALPASAVPITHGAASTKATATPATATTTSRPPPWRAPTRREPSAQATAVPRTSGTIAGANPAAAAITAPRMATCPAGWLRQRSVRGSR